VGRKREPIREEQLHNWKLLDVFRRQVLPLLAARPLSATEQDERRTLFAEDYFCAYLFAMLNPVVTSMRALCHVSHCRKMRQVCSAPLSPASFSAAQHAFAPEVLDQVVRQLAQQALGQSQGQGGDPRVRQVLKTLTAVDGTLLRAVPRMAWAPAAGPTQAVRLHLHFSVFDQLPEAWTITPGNVCERKVFQAAVQPGAMVVADRYFSNHHALLEELRSRGVHFVFRLKDNTGLETLSERALTPADRQAGVVWDRQMRLGNRGHGLFRVVRVEANGDVFHLITTREDLSAELIGLIYRQRWQIELFFKWIKTILNCRHWLAESPAGASIQIYCVLIAALLLMLWTGQRPNKRAVESLRWYWSGWITEEELVEFLRRANRPKKSQT
jgi:hypothetical protein